MNEKEKNPIAVEMGKLRWAKKSDSERKEHMRMMAQKSVAVRAEKREELTILIER